MGYQSIDQSSTTNYKISLKISNFFKCFIFFIFWERKWKQTVLVDGDAIAFSPMNYISESKFCGILKYFDFLIAFSCQLDTKFSQSSKLIPDVISKIVTLTIQISNHIIFHPLENDLKVIFNFF